MSHNKEGLDCILLLDSLLQVNPQTAEKNVQDAFEKFFRCYISLSAVPRRELRSLVTPYEALDIVFMSDVAIYRAIDDRDIEWLRLALYSHDFEGLVLDFRDNHIRIAMTYKAAQLIEQDPVVLFESVASDCQPNVAKYLRDFVNHHRGGGNVLTGMKIKQTDAGLRFVPSE